MYKEPVNKIIIFSKKEQLGLSWCRDNRKLSRTRRRFMKRGCTQGSLPRGCAGSPGVFRLPAGWRAPLPTFQSPAQGAALRWHRLAPTNRRELKY